MNNWRSRRARAVARPRVGWVFAGGGARGAYEIGACSYLFENIERDIGRPVPLDVICGTSIGAIHAAALAASADDPRAGMAQLAARWAALSLNDVIRVDRRRTFNMFRALLGRPPRRPSLEERRGGILDARPLESLVSAAFDFGRIDEHLKAGRMMAVSLSATHVGTGHTTVFFQAADGVVPTWPLDRTWAHSVTLAPEHALASAAIPFLFPAVRIGDQLYCDGSLRQHVPLAPARHLGADALVVINPRATPPSVGATRKTGAENSFPGPMFLLGKTLNALTFDRIEGEIQQIHLVNQVLDAGQQRYGRKFVDQINDVLTARGDAAVKPISLLHIHASEDIGQLSAAFARSPRFRARHRSLLERALARLADGEAGNEADLLSYLLFDGAFARELFDLGWRDAQRQHDEIVRFFLAEKAPAAPVEGKSLAS